jgi:hypothetical protein
MPEADDAAVLMRLDLIGLAQSGVANQLAEVVLGALSAWDCVAQASTMPRAGAWVVRKVRQKCAVDVTEARHGGLKGEKPPASLSRPGMNTNKNGHNGRSTKPHEWFVASLLQSAGQIQLMVHHMLSYDAATGNESDQTIDETLQELITDTVGRLLDRDSEEYAAAAVLLADVRKAIEDEIYLVEPGAFDDLDLDDLDVPSAEGPAEAA